MPVGLGDAGGPFERRTAPTDLAARVGVEHHVRLWERPTGPPASMKTIGNRWLPERLRYINKVNQTGGSAR